MLTAIAAGNHRKKKIKPVYTFSQVPFGMRRLFGVAVYNNIADLERFKGNRENVNPIPFASIDRKIRAVGETAA
jgi:hypothetical protein